MRFVKGISLFFIYPCIMFGLGFLTGIILEDFFYPGRGEKQIVEEDAFDTEENSLLPVSVTEEEILNADTDYVIEEYDTRRDTLVESTVSVPVKYLGMDRDEFVKAMELYALSPPLSEQERGFLGVEVKSFSKNRVVVRMNYAYAEPTVSFYLRVEDNTIVVYCDDNRTVYMYTGISAETLPEYIQSQVIMGMFIKDEAQLYHFLETYSS